MAANRKIPIRPPRYSELTSAGSLSARSGVAVVDNSTVDTVEFPTASSELFVGVVILRVTGVGAMWVVGPGVGVGGCPRL